MLHDKKESTLPIELDLFGINDISEQAKWVVFTVVSWSPAQYTCKVIACHIHIKQFILSQVSGSPTMKALHILDCIAQFCMVFPFT